MIYSVHAYLTILSYCFARIHSNHHDLGGVCAACCHDSNPGGQSISIPSFTSSQIRDIKCLEKLSFAAVICLKAASAAEVSDSGQRMYKNKIDWDFAANEPSDVFFSLQLLSKETTAPFGAELSGDLEQQVSVIITWFLWIREHVIILVKFCTEIFWRDTLNIHILSKTRVWKKTHQLLI